jgi:glycosyltransferase involved in cell wall biosynthesis
VVLLTKNSARVLEECLTSVYQNIPVNHLIVVDGYSTDGTLEIVNRFDLMHHNIRIILDRGTRATAREKGIRQVSTDWFVFVDSDVVLCRDWYRKATENLDKDVGAVWGIEVWSKIQKPSMLKMFLLVTRKIFDLRGGTHDTLVRTDLVKDIKIPEYLHVFEDAFIKDWIEKKGYRVVACYDPFCVHYRPDEVWTLRGSLNIVADAFRFGSVKLLVKLVFAYGFYSAYSVYQLLMNSRVANL